MNPLRIFAFHQSCRRALWTSAVLVLSLGSSAQSQLLLEENFTFTGALTNNGWSAAANANSNALTATSPGLTYPNLPSSGLGNGVSLVNGGEDDYRLLSSSNTNGDIYTSFLVNVTQPRTGDYFYAFYSTATSGGGYFGRVHVRSNSTGFNFGIGKTTAVTGTSPTYETNVRSLNTTYLVVAKMSRSAVSTNDDVVSLWINPALGTSEAVPDITNSVGADSTNFINAVALRQGSSTAAPTLRAGNILVGTTWASVTPTAAAGGPVITSFSPTTGPVGTVVTIAGSNFTGATNITFNSVASTSFTVNGASQITATVPASATTGPIGVNTPLGFGSSADNFVVPSAAVTLPAQINEGATATGAVTLTSAAPVGGVVVSLVSSSPADLAVPVSVTVAEGFTSADFQIEAPLDGSVDADVVVTVTPSAANYVGVAGSITVKNIDISTVPLTAGGYSESFSAFTNAATLPLGWTLIATTQTYSAWETTTAGAKYNSATVDVFGYKHSGSTGVVQQVLTLRNETGSTITDLTVSYFGRAFTNTGDARDPSYTVTVDGQTVSALSYSTADGDNVQRSASLSGLNIAVNQVFQIIWSSDGSTAGSPGSNTRKQIGVGNVSLSPTAALLPPTVGSLSVPLASTAQTSAGVSANVSADGGSAITSRGFVYAPTSINADPAIGGTGVVNVVDPLAELGAMSATLTGLTASTQYSVKAYATNAQGTTYTAVQTFTTLAPPASFAGNFSYAFDNFTGVGSLPGEWTAVSSGNVQAYAGLWTSTSSSAGFYGGVSGPGVIGYTHTSTTGTLTIALRLVNNTGSTLNQLFVSYLGRVEALAGTRFPEWTVTVAGVAAPSLTYSTASGIDETKAATVTGLNVSDGATFDIVWVSTRGENATGNSRRIGLADVVVGNSAPATPNITASPASLSGLTATQGVAGISANFLASASNLSNNITVTANDAVNFAISTNNSDFTNTLTLSTNATGGLSNTPVYVRLTGATAAGSKSNTVSLVSGATSNSVSVSGSVIDPTAPNITVSTNSLTNFVTAQGTASAAKTFTVTGTNLQAEMIVTPPSGYQVSLDGNSWTSTLTVPRAYSAFDDFYVNVPATGGAGDYNRNTWIANAGTVPFNTGLTNPNTWGYAGGNFNGLEAPSSVGTYVSAGNFYPLTSGGTYAGPGASYALTNTNFWIGYNDQYGTVGLPNAQTQIGKYTREWFAGSPNYTGNPEGTNNKFLWLQSTGLSSSTDGLGAMLTWTAPNAGTFQFSGSYVNGNYGQAISFAIVDSLNNTLLAKQTLPPSSATNTFSFTRTYSAGDVVQFQVGTPAATQGSPLGLSVEVTPASVISRLVYVRIAPTALVGPLAGNVTVSSSGAPTRDVAVSGTVNGSGPASIGLNPTSATNLVAFTGSPGTAQQIAVTGTNLPGTVNFAADSNEYEVASQGGNFGVAASLPASGGVALVRIKSGSTVGAVGPAVLVFESGSGGSKVTNSIPINGTRINGGTGGLVPGLQTFAGDLNFTATGRFVWVLKADTVTGRGTEFSGVNVGGNLGVAAGASFDVVLNGAGSSTDFSMDFWKTPRSWLVFSVTGNTTGAFSLGAITPDSGGKYYASYGSFGLRTDGGGDIYLDWTPSGFAVASISVSTPSLSLPSTTTNVAGASTNFTASGVNLTNNITVTANDAANFAISTNNSDFTNTLTLLTNASGGLSSTPVYVRLTGASPAGAKSNTVSLISGTTSNSVTVSGTVSSAPTGPPSVVVVPLEITNLQTDQGTQSVPSTFTLTASNLQGPVTVSAVSPLLVSTDGGATYASSAVVSNTPTATASNTVRVVIGTNNALPGTYTNTNGITFSTPGATNSAPGLTVVNGNFSNLSGLTQASPEWWNGIPTGWTGVTTNFTVRELDPVPSGNFAANLNTLTTASPFVPLYQGVGTLTTASIVSLNFELIPLIAPTAMSAGIFDTKNSTNYNNWTALALPPAAFTTAGLHTLSTSVAIDAGTPIGIAFWQGGGSPGAPAIDNVSVSPAAVAGTLPSVRTVHTVVPLTSLSASPTSLTSMSTSQGVPSAPQSFVVRGSGLTSNVTVSASANLQFTTNTNSAYGASLVLPIVSGALSNTVFARISDTAAVGGPTTNTITASSGATNVNLSAVTTVSSNSSPFIVASPTALSGFSTTDGTPSTNLQTFTAGGTNLTGNLNIVAPAGYEISINGTNFSSLISLAPTGGTPVVTNLAVDDGNNYTSATWTNGANGGTGFGAWAIASTNGTGGFGGVFIGNPTAAGITTNATFGTNAFGMYANPGTSGAFANADRTFAALQDGQTFSFQWAINWDSDVGNKGFSLYSGGTSGTQILNVNQGGFPGDIRFIGGGVTNTNIGLAFGTGPMTWSFAMTSPNNLLVTSSPRDGTTGVAFSTNIAVAAGPGSFRWYVSAMSAGDQRQQYYNNLKIVGTAASGNVSPTTIYVRLSGAAAGSAGGNIDLTSLGAPPKTVALSGTVLPRPVITPTATLTPFAADLGTNSAAQSFTFRGTNLVGDVILTAPAGYEISKTTNGTYTNTLTYGLAEAQPGPATNWVRLAATAPPGIVAGNIALASQGAVTTNVAVTGRVTGDPVVSVLPSALTNFFAAFGTNSDSQTFVVRGVDLDGPIVLTASNSASWEMRGSADATWTNIITLAASNSAPVALAQDNASNYGDSVVISYVGSETGLPVNDYAVQNWSNPDVAKAYDTGGSEVYGTAGYYQIRPMPTNSSTNIFEAAGAGNNLGIGASTDPTLASAPVFLSSATGGAGSFVNFNGYSTYRAPDGSAIYRQGALSVSVNNGPFNSPAGADASYFGIAMSVTLNTNGNFRLGLAVDSVGSGDFAPNYISIYNPAEGGVFSGPLTRDGNADMAFFDIKGASGDTFDFALWQNVGTNSVAALSLVTFDDLGARATGWTNNSTGGSGFGSWSITTDGDATATLGNPATAGIGGMGTDAFALQGTTGYATAQRTFDGPLLPGDTFSLQWGNNWDTGGAGNKGLNVYAGGFAETNQLININMGGGAEITINGQPMFTQFGTNAVTLNFQYVAAGQLRVFGTGRNGAEAFDRTFVVSGAPDRFSLYAGQFADSAPQRVAYANNLAIVSGSTGPSVDPTEISVRIKSDAALNPALTGTVTAESTNATPAVVTLEGVVSADPEIAQTSSFLPFLAVQGFPSDPQTFTVGGVNLQADVSVAPPSGYEASLDGNTWSASVSVPRTGIITPQQAVYVRIASTTPVGTPGGNILLGSLNAPGVTIPITGEVVANTGPQLTATPSALPAFSTDVGTSSAAQSFALTGRGLSDPVVLAAPSGFVLSTNAATFVSNSTITPLASGFLSNTISVRMSGAEEGFFAGKVTATSGVTNTSVAVRGTVFAAGAQIAVSPTNLSGFATVEGTPSAAQAFQTAARNLGSTNLVATASAGYELSTNSTNFFANSLPLAPVSGAIDPVEIFVRIAATATNTNSLAGSVTLTSGSAAPATVALNGKVDPRRPPAVTLVSPSNNPTIIAPGSTIRLQATAVDTNVAGSPGTLATFEFLTNGVPIPGAVTNNVLSPATLQYDWTPSLATASTQVSARAIDTEGMTGASASVEVRFPNPGEPIVGFVPPLANGVVETVAGARGGAFYVAGRFTALNALPARRVARVLSDGAVDPEFYVGDQGPNNTVNTMLPSADGLYIGGWFTAVEGVPAAGIARLSIGQPGVVDGTLDPDFIPVPALEGVTAGSNPVVEIIAEQHDGKLLVGGSFRVTSDKGQWLNVARYWPDGTLDETFGALLPDPVTGEETLVPPNPNGVVNAISLQPDGRILLGGSFARAGNQARRGLARLRADGSLDESLVVGSGFNGEVNAVIAVPGGGIYVGGQFTSFKGRFLYNNLVRLSSTGDLDPRFNFSNSTNPGGGLNGAVSSLLVRGAGGVLATGSFTIVSNDALPFGPQPAGRIVQMLPDGLPDPVFQPGTGANNTVHSAAVLANGNIVIVGAFTGYNGQPLSRIAVLAGAPASAPVVTSRWYATVPAGKPFDFAFTSGALGPVVFEVDDSVAGPTLPANFLPWGVKPHVDGLGGTPLQAGSFPLRVRAVENAGQPAERAGDWTPFELYVLRAPVSFATWQGVWFNETQLDDPSVSGPDAKASSSALLRNFAVYALHGGSPWTAGPSINPMISFVDDEDDGVAYLTLTAGINPLAEAVFGIEYAPNLANPWQSVPSTVSPEGDSVEGRALVPASGQKSQFLRLKIEPSPAAP